MADAQQPRGVTQGGQHATHRRRGADARIGAAGRREDDSRRVRGADAGGRRGIDIAAAAARGQPSGSVQVGGDLPGQFALADDHHGTARIAGVEGRWAPGWHGRRDSCRRLDPRHSREAQAQQNGGDAAGLAVGQSEIDLDARRGGAPGDVGQRIGGQGTREGDGGATGRRQTRLLKPQAEGDIQQRRVQAQVRGRAAQPSQAFPIAGGRALDAVPAWADFDNAVPPLEGSGVDRLGAAAGQRGRVEGAEFEGAGFRGIQRFDRGPGKGQPFPFRGLARQGRHAVGSDGERHRAAFQFSRAQGPDPAQVADAQRLSGERFGQQSGESHADHGRRALQ